METDFDIVGFGICTVDFLGLVERYPEAGEKVRMREFSKQGGGLTGTALAAAARLGARCAYLGKLGRDEYSDFLIEAFRRDGVDVEHVQRVEGVRPPLSFIHVRRETGERRITWHGKDIAFAPEELNRTAIENSRVLFLDHFYTHAGMAACTWARQSDTHIVADAERLEPGFLQILQRADYIIAAEGFAAVQTGERSPDTAAGALQRRFGGTVVVTAGQRGAYGTTGGATFHQPAFRVEVVDTTGAGDVFHGAFMVGLVENWPLEKTVQFAAAVAALKCRGLGGRDPIPTRAEALAFLREHGNAAYWSD